MVFNFQRPLPQEIRSIILAPITSMACINRAHTCLQQVLALYSKHQIFFWLARLYGCIQRHSNILLEQHLLYNYKHTDVDITIKPITRERERELAKLKVWSRRYSENSKNENL